MTAAATSDGGRDARDVNGANMRSPVARCVAADAAAAFHRSVEFVFGICRHDSAVAVE